MMGYPPTRLNCPSDESESMTEIEMQVAYRVDEQEVYPIDFESRLHLKLWSSIRYVPQSLKFRCSSIHLQIAHACDEVSSS